MKNQSQKRQTNQKGKALRRRKGLNRLAEEEAVQEVLRASKEPTLKGNLDELLRKFS